MVQEKHAELLCETCGYQIASIRDSGACPECGRSKSLSLPAARTGTPWQNARSITGWFSNAKRLITSPRSTFEQLRIQEDSARPLLILNLSLAAAFMAHPFIGVFRFDPAQRIADQWSVSGLLTLASSVAVLWTLAMVVLVGLTVIEYLGIRFFAARRQWRLLPAAALQICAHSSLAWIAASLLLIVGLSLSSAFPQTGAARVTVTFWDEILGGMRRVLPALPPALGFLAGMMWFEWLVYVGVRSCKFANAPTIAAERTKG